MKRAEFVRDLGSLPDTQLDLCGPPQPDEIRGVLGLPPLHAQLLGWTNGLMSYGGYLRLFGAGGGHFSIEGWNVLDVWKFAWPTHVTEFVCFAETAWGDQYAYSRAELGKGQTARVYQLEAITMSPEVISPSFERFLDYFLRNCLSPADDMLREARKKLGSLAVHEHITYVPSLLVSGTETVESIEKMPATVAMIANGDMAAQLANESPSRTIERIDQVVDAVGRPRLKVVWAE